MSSRLHDIKPTAENRMSFILWFHYKKNNALGHRDEPSTRVDPDLKKSNQSMCPSIDQPDDDRLAVETFFVFD